MIKNKLFKENVIQQRQSQCLIKCTETRNNQNIIFNGENIFGGHECQGYMEQLYTGD